MVRGAARTVAGLLHAAQHTVGTGVSVCVCVASWERWFKVWARPVADRGKLIGEVAAARVGGVEVRLDDERKASAHDTIAMLTAQRGLHARDALIRHTLHQADVELDLVCGTGAAWV